MNEGLQEYRRKVAAGEVQIVIKNPIEKALENPKSLRLAINAKCYDCEGRDADPKVKWRIGNCQCHDCPLYPVRPYQYMQEDV